MSVPAMLPLITTVTGVSSTTAMHSVSTSNVVLLLWKTFAVHLLVLSLLGVLVFVRVTSSQRPSLNGRGNQHIDQCAPSVLGPCCDALVL